MKEMNMIRVDYNGLVADIRENHLEEGLRILSSQSDEERGQLMKSVVAALDEVLELVEKGKKCSPKQLQNAADDIGLWFANEVLEGRAEQYRSAMN